MTLSPRRIYIKAVMNGFHVEFNDHSYNEEVYVFTNWDDAVACIKERMPIVEETKTAEVAVPATSI